VPLTPEGLVAKLGEVSKVGKVASERSVRQGAAIIRTEALAALVAAGVHGFRLRGVGHAGARLGVVNKTFGAGSGLTAAVHATGPWQFIERDTPRHEVGARAADRGDQPRLNFGNGEWATGPFMAGGSTGKHPWRLGTGHAKGRVAKLYEKEVGAAIRRAF
jgi:hypothetical protein